MLLINKYFHLIWLICILFPSFSYVQDWRIQETITGTFLNDVCFADTLHGWAVGANGYILHTQNGGKTWEIQDSGTSKTLRSVIFVYSLYGWVVGNSGREN